MLTSRAALYGIWSALTIFLSAFLLFQVQPVITKMILPWFGGGPAVWTVCLLFFQVVLLCGYAYAHTVVSSPRPRAALLVHLALLASAAWLLPITPAAAWKPADGAQPTWRILTLLAAHIGLPYFVLSATGPLVQAWYHRVLVDRSPYRLYALSNVGSLGALLSYPFLVEPALTTTAQGTIWSLLFVLFALLCAALAMASHRGARAEAGAGSRGLRQPVGNVWDPPPSMERRLAWLFFPALASVMLMAVTNHVCQDVAVVPFLWVLPLSLYLLSFILCFDRPFWYRRRLFALASLVAVFSLCLEMLDRQVEVLLARLGIDLDISDYTGGLIFQGSVYLLALFLVCMVCHGELVRLKPAPHRLTSFYMMVSAGGALGGIFVGLFCPQVFSSFVELNIALVAAFMLAMGVLWDDFWETWLLRGFWSKCAVFSVGFGLLFIVVRAQFESVATGDLAAGRNFYGTLVVRDTYREDPDWHIRELLNGRILHGSQFQADGKRILPTTYYNSESGIGITMRRFRSDRPRRVAIVGLGTGTMSVYGQAGDAFSFYEIDPLVTSMARSYFSYLDTTLAHVRIVPGDARLSMERQSPQAYDILVLDAFTGDAIPAHLLTREAFVQYLRHLTRDGVIAVHTSNRYLDLTPVVAGMARHFGLGLRRIRYAESDGISEASSDWMLMTHHRHFFNDPLVQQHAETVEGSYQPVRLWTDQYSNLFQILR